MANVARPRSRISRNPLPIADIKRELFDFIGQQTIIRADVCDQKRKRFVGDFFAQPAELLARGGTYARLHDLQFADDEVLAPAPSARPSTGEPS